VEDVGGADPSDADQTFWGRIRIDLQGTRTHAGTSLSRPFEHHGPDTARSTPRDRSWAGVPGASYTGVVERTGYELVERDPTVEEYQRLRRAVGWSAIADEGVAAGLPNALFSVVLLHEDETIGCGRVVGDGGLYFYIQDIAVLPEYQGRGLGRMLMDAVMVYLERAAKPGAFIGLMAAKDAAPFYEKYGFAARSERQPGMFRKW